MAGIFEVWLNWAFYDFKVSYEDKERYSKIVKIVSKVDQDNEDIIICVNPSKNKTFLP